MFVVVKRDWLSLLREKVVGRLRWRSEGRFLELDVFRGVAVFLMLFGHLLWDLDFFGVLPLHLGVYHFIQLVAPPMFFGLVGVGLSLSSSRAVRGLSRRQVSRLVLRGLSIIALGFVLTAFSFVILPARPIYFGVLHCIGLSIILAIVFLPLRSFALVPGVVLVVLGYVVSGMVVADPSVVQFVLGLHQAEVWRFTVDYFPLLPWFGVVLCGMGLGFVLYDGRRRRFRVPDVQGPMVRGVSYVGQQSLLVYLLHQPVIAGVVYVVAFALHM